MVITASVRTILHMATVLNWEIKQIDEKNTFCMEILPRQFTWSSLLILSIKRNLIIFGHKQAPRVWFDKLSYFLIDFGFVCSKSDPSIFVYPINKDKIILLRTLCWRHGNYTGNSSTVLTDLLQKPQIKCKMNDMGRLHYFLGFKFKAIQMDCYLSTKICRRLTCSGFDDWLCSNSQSTSLQLKKIPDQS